MAAIPSWGGGREKMAAKYRPLSGYGLGGVPAGRPVVWATISFLKMTKPPVWSHLLSGCQAGVEQTRRKTCWYGSTYQLPEAYSHVLRWLSALGLGGLRWAYSVESHRLNTLYAVCLYERLHTYSGRTEPLYGAGPRGPSREGGESVCDIDTIIVV